MALNLTDNAVTVKEKPLCPLFGTCGGCRYQDISYEEELVLKSKELRRLLTEALTLGADVLEPNVPSPQPYYYRNRLDLTLRKDREGEWRMERVSERV